MSLSFIAEANNTDTGSATCNKPTGTTNGDKLIATVGVYTTSGAITCTGWTLEATINDGNSRQLIFSKVAGSSEPTSYTWSGGSYYDITISCFRSSTLATIVLDGAVSNSNNSTGTCPSVSATNTGEILYVSWVTDQNSGVSSISVSNGVTRDTPTGSQGTSGNDGLFAGHKVLTASGATGTTQWTTVGGAGMGVSLLLMEQSSGSTKSSGAFAVGGDVGGIAATAQRLRGSGLVNVGGDVGGISASAGAVRQTGLVGVCGDVGGIAATATKGGVKQASVVMGADVGGITAQYGRLRNSGPSVMGADTGGVVTTSTGGIFPSGAVNAGGDTGGIQAFAAKQGNGPVPTSYKHQVRMATSFQQLP